MGMLRRFQLTFSVLRLMFRADLRRALLSFTPIVAASSAASYVGARNLLQALFTDDRDSVVWATGLFTAAFLGSAWVGRVARTARLQLGEAVTFEFQVRRAGAVLAPERIEHLERADYLDKLETLRARSFDVFQAPRMFGWLVDSGGGLIVSILLLFFVQPVLVLVVLGGIPAAYMNSREQSHIRDGQAAEAARTRRALHLYDLATRPEAAGEVRVAGVGPELLGRYHDEWVASDKALFRSELRAGLVNAAGWLAQAMAFAVGVAVLVDGVRGGSVPPADVFLAVGAMSLVVGQVGQAVGGVTSLGQILWLFDNLEELEAEADRLEGDLEPTSLGAPDRLTEGISLRGVSFRYSTAESDALVDVDLHLPAGSVVAVVGDNGAGKSTLVKLLFGLYRPTAGSISVDGRDLAEMNLSDWRERCSACFQDYLQPELSAQESIGVGNLAEIENETAVRAAAQRAAATSVIDELPDGLASQLGERFGGTDLSGGQWQKLAISRAMMARDPLLLALDEPSASLDALTEHEIFQGYAETAREVGARLGAITVLVSHRFSTVSMADRIVVLEDGRAAEVGSHDELMARGGSYAQMYELQARHYR